MKKPKFFNNKTLRITLLLFLLICSIQCKRSPSNSQPNIVLIIVDALRADHLGCYGFSQDISPEIDRIAREGVLFENIFTQCSWTRPSVGSMLTSRYPRSLGLFNEKFDQLADESVTLPEILKDHGYTTIGITANPNINSFFHFQQGFDQYIDSSVVWNWMKIKEAEKYIKEAPLPQSGEIFQTLLEKKLLKKTPVYLQILLMEVHSPYLIREEFTNVSSLSSLQKPNKHVPEEELISLINGTRNAVRQMSVDIFAFMDELLAKANWENTLFVITSDHGQGLDDHPEIRGGIGHGLLLYESQLRVPLILYQKEGRLAAHKGLRIEERVRLLDLAPTLLDFIGITPHQDMLGKSVLTLLSGQKSSLGLPEYFVAETNWRDADKISVYSDKWKYIENRDNWEDVNAFELQEMSTKENGRLTDKIAEFPDTALLHKTFLSQWEERFQKAKASQPLNSLNQKEIEQLKSLGYIK